LAAGWAKKYIDGQLRWEVRQAVSHHSEFVIFSTEVKSGLWSGPVPPHGYGDRTSSQTKLTVDYLRYYQKGG